jgi:hypothetical protein
MGRHVPGFEHPPYALLLRASEPPAFPGAEVGYFGGLFCLLRFGAASE